MTTEAASKGSRATLPDWLPEGACPSPLIGASEKPSMSALGDKGAHEFPVGIRSLPELPTLPAALAEVDDDDEPTRVVRRFAEKPNLSTDGRDEPRNQVPIAASPHRPPIPMRHGIAHNSERFEPLPGTSAVTETVLQNPTPLDERAVTETEPRRYSPQLPSSTLTTTPNPNLPAAVAPILLNVGVVQPNAEVPTIAPAYQSIGPAPYSVLSNRKRRGALVFPILGLGLGIAVAGGLVQLMYGNSTSVKRDSRAAGQSTSDSYPPSVAVTRILSAQVAPSAIAVDEPSAVAALLAAPAAPASAKREIKLALPTAAGRGAAEARIAQGKQDAHATHESRSIASDSDTAKIDAPATEVARQSQSSKVKVEFGKSDKERPADAEEPAGESFDAEAASSALESAAERASACRQPSDPSGVAVVTVTFAPTGRVTTATVAGPPFVGTPTGSCIAATMRSAKLPAFFGAHMTVRKTVTIR